MNKYLKVCCPCRVLGSVPELEEGGESSDDDLGPDGWDDVLSAWMGSAGLPDVWSGAAASAHSPATSTSHTPARQRSPLPTSATTTADKETPTPLRSAHSKPPVGPSSGRSSLETKPVSPPSPSRLLQLYLLPQVYWTDWIVIFVRSLLLFSSCIRLQNPQKVGSAPGPGLHGNPTQNTSCCVCKLICRALHPCSERFVARLA